MNAVLIILMLNASGLWVPLPMDAYIPSVKECRAKAPGIISSLEFSTKQKYGFLCVDAKKIERAGDPA